MWDCSRAVMITQIKCPQRSEKMSEHTKGDEEGPIGVCEGNEERITRGEPEYSFDADATVSVETGRRRQGKREGSVSSIDSCSDDETMVGLWIVQVENEKRRANGAPPLSTKEEVKMSSKDSSDYKSFSLSQLLLPTTPAYESNVKQFRLVPMYTVGDWRVKRVVSPFEIYLEFLLDETIGNGDLPKRNYHSWWPRMQQFYSDLESPQRFQTKGEDIRVGQCFVVEEQEPNNPSQSKWHRVRVLKLRPQEEKAFILFCDIGEKRFADYSQLHKLDPEFAQYDAHLFRCYLYNVIPTTFKSSKLHWPAEAIAFFKDAMKRYEGRKISGVILARTGSAVQSGIPDVYRNLGMLLFEILDRAGICTLNALMVKRGYAHATGIFASCPHQLGRPGRWERPKFDEEEFRRLHPELYEEQLEPAGPPPLLDAPIKHIPSIIKIDQYNNLVQYYSTSPEIKWHRQNPLRVVVEQKQIDWIPSTIQEKVAHVKIKYSRGPQYIIMQIGNEAKALADMERAIGRTVQYLQSISAIQPGQFVAFQAVKPKPNSSKKKEEECPYFRGMIISSTDVPQYYKVLAVDYGQETFIHKNGIYPLLEYFCEIPSFAIRAHLAVPGIIPAHAGENGGECGWSDQAKQLLLKYVMSWEDSSPLYYAYRPPNTESIKLDSLHQEVVFDKGREKWIPGGLPKGARRASAEMRNHPLTKSLLNSIGVWIQYEIKLENSFVWNFGDLHDDLLDKKEAVPAKKASCDTRIHFDITDEWLFNVMKQAVKFAN